MLFLAMLAAVAPIQVRVDNSEFANAIYHLSCLSERIPCTKPEIEKFWRETLYWTDADQRQMEAWKGALHSVARRQPKPAETPFLPNFGRHYPELAATREIIAAALGSRSTGEFRKRTRGLGSREEIDQLSAASEHFRRRLHPWWVTKGKRYADVGGKAVGLKIRSASTKGLAEQIARFMEAQIENRDFRVHLIPRNDRESERATGTFVGNHLLVELTDQMKPEGAVAIVMHELTHALYELAPLERHRHLVGAFATAPQPHAQVLYTLLNEGLATGVQVAMIRRAGIKDEGAYRHAYIPRVGRAVAAPLERALKDGPTLFSGFLKTYLQVTEEEFRKEAGSPTFLLSAVALAPIGELPASEKAFRASFPVIIWGDFADRGRYPEANLVILITYDKLEALSNWEELAPFARRHRGFAFTSPRMNKGTVYVLAGRDDETVVEVVRRLAAVQSARNGLVLGVD